LAVFGSGSPRTTFWSNPGSDLNANLQLLNKNAHDLLAFSSKCPGALPTHHARSWRVWPLSQNAQWPCQPGTPLLKSWRVLVYSNSSTDSLIIVKGSWTLLAQMPRSFGPLSRNESDLPQPGGASKGRPDLRYGQNGPQRYPFKQNAPDLNAFKAKRS